MNNPLITVAVPSLDQGEFLEEALVSIFSQDLPIEVILVDGGSKDNTLAIIEKWSDKLTWWRSHADKGQPAAINEAISLGRAPYVCWLNSDDIFLPGGLQKLLNRLRLSCDSPLVYGNCRKITKTNQYISDYPVRRFSKRRLAVSCCIAQPATLIRRSAWEAVGGLNEDLHLAFDYDFWWKLYNEMGSFDYFPEPVAIARMHSEAKSTKYNVEQTYEAMQIVKNYYGRIPLRWYVQLNYCNRARKKVRVRSHIE